MITLVASKRDKAGMNIAKHCEKLGLKVHYIKEDIIFAKELPDADAYIFLSRHKSKSGKPCLTAHFPGVFSEDNPLGGNPYELGIAFPSLEKRYITNLSRLKEKWNKKELEKYQIVLEATHHGPTHFKKPIMFVEVGSSEYEWEDELAADLVAHAVKETLENINPTQIYKTAIAFGGTHYPKKFTDVILKEDYSIGHIMPKYALLNLNEEILKQMIEKSTEEIKYCIIDWKGCNIKSEIIELIGKYKLEIVRI